MRNERLLIIVLIFCWALSMAAQQMEVHDFKHHKRYIWNRSKVAVDKQRALLDLYTTEKGFTFFANGKEAAEAEEGDGLITVKLPNKTRYVTIKHDTYGQLTWRVPKKYLKRKKHYCATLLTSDPTKKYQLKNQWVTLTISPENAVAQIDSVMQLVRDGKVALFLPVGKHRYEVQSPYYEAVCDSFVLTDTAKVELAINLQPVYAYVVVKTPWNSGKIYVDGQQIGKGQAQSGRLADGEHRLAVFLSDYCIYDKPFQIGRAEKKLIEDYIKRNGIQVIYKEPEVWGEKDYLKVEGYDNFYFHLVERGTTDTVDVKAADRVLVRYKKYTLDEYSDTISYWGTDDGGYPITFTYADTYDTRACAAWHAAITLMKRSGSTCEIICPSKLGFDAEKTNVTPYAYKLMFKIRRF